MTEVHFYTGVDNKAIFACRLASKAVERGRRVVVHSRDADLLNRFDQALWTLEQTSFVPHVHASDPLAPQTPVVLSDDADTGPSVSLPHHEVLINLDDDWPRFFSRFEWLLEVVGTDDADVLAGRTRWKVYQDRGYKLEHHPSRAST